MTSRKQERTGQVYEVDLSNDDEYKELAKNIEQLLKYVSDRGGRGGRKTRELRELFKFGPNENTDFNKGTWEHRENAIDTISRYIWMLNRYGGYEFNGRSVEDNQKDVDKFRVRFWSDQYRQLTERYVVCLKGFLKVIADPDVSSPLTFDKKRKSSRDPAQITAASSGGHSLTSKIAERNLLNLEVKLKSPPGVNYASYDENEVQTRVVSIKGTFSEYPFQLDGYDGREYKGIMSLILVNLDLMTSNQDLCTQLFAEKSYEIIDRVEFSPCMQLETPQVGYTWSLRSGDKSWSMDKAALGVDLATLTAKFDGHSHVELRVDPVQHINIDFIKEFSPTTEYSARIKQSVKAQLLRKCVIKGLNLMCSDSWVLAKAVLDLGAGDES